MTVHADPYAQAKKISTTKQAARLKASLESELALNDNLPLGWESQAERGLEHLQENFPDAEHDSAYEEAPGLSRGAQKGLDPPRPRRRTPPPRPPPRRQPPGPPRAAPAPRRPTG